MFKLSYSSAAGLPTPNCPGVDLALRPFVIQVYSAIRTKDCPFEIGLIKGVTFIIG